MVGNWLVLPVLIVLIFTHIFPASAANECGAEAVGADTVTCPSPANFPSGITYANSDGITLILGSPVIVGTAQARSTNANTRNITVELGGGSITASTNHGILARNSGTSGDAIIHMMGGSIGTVGNDHEGLFSLLRNGTGMAIATMSGGNINTSGVNSDGIVAQVESTSAFVTAHGSASIDFSGGLITTSGDGSAGLVAQTHFAFFSPPSTGNATVRQLGGDIRTTGHNAGLLQSSYGILAWAAGSGLASVEQIDGSIETTGGQADGVLAFSTQGNTSIRQTSDGSINATGADSNGILATALAGNNRVSVNGFTHGGSGLGAGISTETNADGLSEHHIGSGADVTALSGVALRNNLGNSQTLVDGSATVAGSFLLNDGDDILTFDGVDLTNVTILDGGDDVSTGDGFIDVLNFSNLTASRAGEDLLNWETINVQSGATITLTGASLVTGTESGQGLFISNGGEIRSQGVFTLTGNVDNAGILTLSNGTTADIFRITGDYTGNGGRVVLNTTLGADNSPSDLLHIMGNSTGTSQLRVIKTGGTGAKTNGDGIKVVQVDGQSDGTFQLLGDYIISGQQALVGGAYGYTLHKNGVANPNDGDWFLRSEIIPDKTSTIKPLYQPGAPIFESYGQALLTHNTVSTLQQRVGGLDMAGGSIGPCGSSARDDVDDIANDPNRDLQAQPCDEHPRNAAIWARADGTLARATPSRSTTGAKLKSRAYELQSGLDVLLNESSDGRVVAGINIGQSSGTSDVRSFYGDGKLETDGTSIGATLTWYGDTGLYVDAQGRATWYETDLSSRILGQLDEGNDSFGYVLSLEAGKRVALAPSWSLVPQAQLYYSNVRFDAFSQSLAGQTVAEIHSGEADAFTGRLGLSLENKQTWTNSAGQLEHSNIYGIVNIYRAFGGSNTIEVSGAGQVGRASLLSKPEDLWGGIGLGGTYAWAENTYAVYGEVEVVSAFDDPTDNVSASGTVGLKVRW